MRIITGKYKGRHFEIPRSFKARPTTDFAKENLFNVLMGYVDFDDAMCLDLFAGTGSISLEMLSRGAANVVSVEQDRDHCNFIRQCMQKIAVENNMLVRGDVFRFLKSCRQKFDFVFADPPYALPNLASLPEAVLGKCDDQSDCLLAPEGVFVLEHGKQYDFSAHPRFKEMRTYGSVHFSIFA